MRETWDLQKDPLEKEMATHYSVLAWRIPWMGEPGGLQSMGSHRVGHDWATSLHFAFLKTHSFSLNPIVFVSLENSNTNVLHIFLHFILE